MRLPPTKDVANARVGDIVVDSVCKNCFQEASSLNKAATVDIIGPGKGDAPCVVLVHGGGSCRTLYATLARRLADAGFRCVLPDLPGHGCRMDEPMSTQNCLSVLKATIDEHCAPYRGVNPIDLGGSIGGYLGMELIGAYPECVSAAVIVAASQTVGVGASLKARAALQAMRLVGDLMWQKTMINGLVSKLKQIPDVNHAAVVESLMGQMYFRQMNQFVGALRATNSLEAVKRFHGPIFYAVGLKDHRDMEERQIAISKANHPSSQLVHYDGDHFFSHDLRANGQITERFIGDTRYLFIVKR